MIIKNFLFHRVSDEPDLLWPPMSVSLFKTLVAYISRHYHVISLEEFLLNPAKEKFKATPATILFDDGYKDNIEYAVPVLEKYKCPASFYVVTECIDKNIPTWTYIVDYLFQFSAKDKIELDLNFVPAGYRYCKFENKAGRLNFGGKLKPWMKSLSNDERRKILDLLSNTFDDVSIPRNKMMNWDEIRQINRMRYSIGSHSVSHPLLASVKDDTELLYELQESGKRIENETGKFPTTISYPVGSYDERVMAFSKDAGYKFGLAVKQHFYNTKGDDSFAIPRVELYNEPMWKCKLRMSGAYSWMKNMIPS